MTMEKLRVSLVIIVTDRKSVNKQFSPSLIVNLCVLDLKN